MLMSSIAPEPRNKRDRVLKLEVVPLTENKSTDEGAG